MCTSSRAPSPYVKCDLRSPKKYGCVNSLSSRLVTLSLEFGTKGDVGTTKLRQGGTEIVTYTSLKRGASLSNLRQLVLSKVRFRRLDTSPRLSYTIQIYTISLYDWSLQTNNFKNTPHFEFTRIQSIKYLSGTKVLIRRQTEEMPRLSPVRPLILCNTVFVDIISFSCYFSLSRFTSIMKLSANRQFSNLTIKVDASFDLLHIWSNSCRL